MAGSTRRPAWMAGGECPGRCDFVHDGRAVPPTFSKLYRLRPDRSCPQLRANGISSYSYLVNVPNHLSMSNIMHGRHGLVIYSRPMRSLWAPLRWMTIILVHTGDTLKKNYGTHVIKLDIAPKAYPLGQHLFISASNNMFYRHSQ